MASKLFYGGGKLDTENLNQFADIIDNLFGGCTNVKQPGSTILDNLKNIMASVDPVSSTGKQEKIQIPDEVLNNVVDMFFNAKPPSSSSSCQSPQEKHEFDIIDEESEYQVHIDVPGFNKEDIGLNITEKNKLCVKSERSYSPGKKYVTKLRKIFKETTIDLPEDIDTKMVNARYENGVLIVTIGKRNNKSNGSKIEIK